MEVSSQFLPRPQFDLSASQKTDFEELWKSSPPESFIDYQLPYPKWQYLSYLCENKELVLHGSQNEGIEVVEPRNANDIRAFSNQRAIYATTDGIWVIYFAILNRKLYPEMSLFNSCFQARVSTDQLSDPMYFFSITQSVLVQKPWCGGAIYILPRQNFIQEAAQQIQGVEIIFPHWISSIPAKPVGRIMVGPTDFPFLAQIHGHDDAKLVKLYAANPGVFPLEAIET